MVYANSVDGGSIVLHNCLEHSGGDFENFRIGLFISLLHVRIQQVKQFAVISHTGKIQQTVSGRPMLMVDY